MPHYGFLFFCVVFLLAHLAFAAEGGSEVEEKAEVKELRKQILSHYNKTVPPSFENSPTDTGIFLLTTRLIGLDDATATMTVEAYLGINWIDSRLSWADDPIFNSTMYISVNSDDLWKPSMNVLNRGRGTRYGHTGVPANCLRRGSVWWWLAAELHPACVPEDLRWFPVDTHTCILELGALYPQEFMSFMLETAEDDIKHGVNRRLEIQTPHWDLLALDHRQDFVSDLTGQFFSVDRFTFRVRRQRSVLVLVFVSLMLSCSAISWSSLALPATGGTSTRRLSLTTSAFLLQSLCLNSLVLTTPGVAVRPPVIVKVYAYFVVLTFLTLLHTVLLSSLFRKLLESSSIFRAMPPPLQHLLGFGKAGQSTAVKGLLGEEEEQSDQQEPRPLQKESADSDGYQAVEAWDRIHLLAQAPLVVLGVTVLVLV